MLLMAKAVDVTDESGPAQTDTATTIIMKTSMEGTTSYSNKVSKSFAPQTRSSRHLHHARAISARLPI